MDTTLFSQLFLPITLAIITLGLGLSISIDDLKNIITDPKNILVGLLCQLILLPIIAYAIVRLTGLSPLFAVGLILIAICPGGVTSNLVNFMLKGNVALSVSITVINGFITIYTIPLLTMVALDIFLGEHNEFAFTVWDGVLNIILVTALPATIGVLIRAYATNFALRLERPLRIILPILLLLIYSGVLFLEQNGTSVDSAMFLKLLPYTLALNLLSIVAGFFLPALFGLVKRNRTTIAVEVGLQNSTLAIFVAGSLLENNMIALVPVVYGSFSFFSTWGLGYLMRRYLK